MILAAALLRPADPGTWVTRVPGMEISREVFGPGGTEALRRQITTHTATTLTWSKKHNSVWVRWKNRPHLIVRTASVEILGWQRRRRRIRSYVFAGEAATMRRDHMDLFGLPIRRYECVRIRIEDGIRFAVSPEDLNATWEALAVAGVRPA